MYSVVVYSLVQLAFILCKCFVTFCLFFKKVGRLYEKKSWNAFHNLLFFFRSGVHSVPLTNQKQDGAGSSPCAFPSLICNEPSSTTNRWVHFHRKPDQFTYVTHKVRGIMWSFSIARIGGTVLNIYFGASWALSFVVAIICNFLSSRLLQYFSTRLTRFYFSI